MRKAKLGFAFKACSSFTSKEKILNPPNSLSSLGYNAPSETTDVHCERRDLHHYNLGYGQLFLSAPRDLSESSKILYWVRCINSGVLK